MLKLIAVAAITACLLLGGIAYAESPEITVIHPNENVIELIASSDSNAPPAAVMVDGEFVGRGGQPDCSKAENRPICQSLLAALENESCNGSPDFVIVYGNGRGALLICVGNAEAPPPVVIHNW